MLHPLTLKVPIMYYNAVKKGSIILSRMFSVRCLCKQKVLRLVEGLYAGTFAKGCFRCPVSHLCVRSNAWLLSYELYLHYVYALTIDKPVFSTYAPLKKTMDRTVVTKLNAKLTFPLRKIQMDSRS